MNNYDISFTFRLYRNDPIVNFFKIKSKRLKHILKVCKNEFKRILKYKINKYYIIHKKNIIS